MICIVVELLPQSFLSCTQHVLRSPMVCSHCRSHIKDCCRPLIVVFWHFLFSYWLVTNSVGDDSLVAGRVEPPSVCVPQLSSHLSPHIQMFGLILLPFPRPPSPHRSRSLQGSGCSHYCRHPWSCLLWLTQTPSYCLWMRPSMFRCWRSCWPSCVWGSGLFSWW